MFKCFSMALHDKCKPSDLYSCQFLIHVFLKDGKTSDIKRNLCKHTGRNNHTLFFIQHFVLKDLKLVKGDTSAQPGFEIFFFM